MVDQFLLLDRKTRIEQRIEALVTNFDHYLSFYDARPPFDKLDQLNCHVRTIRLRRDLGTAYEAALNSEFCKSLYDTLWAWGIGRRASRLVSLEAFAENIASRAPEISGLDGIAIDDPSLDVRQTAEKAWRVIESLGIVENISRLVPGTKALHHLLPDLIVPMDRAYTQTFFGLHNPEFQGQWGSQRPVFVKAFETFAWIARAAKVNSYVEDGQPWRTSRTKVIDNALIGYCIDELLPKVT
jgi:hypothetical protein